MRGKRSKQWVGINIYLTKKNCPPIIWVRRTYGEFTPPRAARRTDQWAGMHFTSGSGVNEHYVFIMSFASSGSQSPEAAAAVAATAAVTADWSSILRWTWMRLPARASARMSDLHARSPPATSSPPPVWPPALLPGGICLEISRLHALTNGIKMTPAQHPADQTQLRTLWKTDARFVRRQHVFALCFFSFLGQCLCGQCTCHPPGDSRIHGKNCECDDRQCEDISGEVCGGNTRTQRHHF